MREIKNEIRADFLASGHTRCTRLEPQPNVGTPADGPEHFCPSFCTNCGQRIESTGVGRGWRHDTTERWAPEHESERHEQMTFETVETLTLIDNSGKPYTVKHERFVADEPFEIDRSALTSLSATKIVAEASDLRLPIGQFPLELRTADRFGRPVTFERVSIVRDREGEITHARYVTNIRRSPAWVTSVELTVFND